MKKNISLILLCVLIIISISGCKTDGSKVKKETNIIQNYEKLIFSITSVNKVCIPVQLSVYNDGKYELFVAYKACKPGKTCNLMLTYTKSIKGTYNYDVEKIIENSVRADNEAYSTANLPEYEIYMGNSYVEKGYDYYYTVEKNQTNKYLDEFLKEINVNLKGCAEQEYID